MRSLPRLLRGKEGDRAHAGQTPQRVGARRELHETGLGAGPPTRLAVFSGEAHHHVSPDGHVVAWVTVLSRAEPSISPGEARAGDAAAEARWWPLHTLPGDVSAATRAYFTALRSSPRGSR